LARGVGTGRVNRKGNRRGGANREKGLKFALLLHKENQINSEKRNAKKKKKGEFRGGEGNGKKKEQERRAKALENKLRDTMRTFQIRICKKGGAASKPAREKKPDIWGGKRKFGQMGFKTGNAKNKGMIASRIKG